MNTIKRYSSRIIIKFERDKGSLEISLCVCSVRVFTKFSGNPYYEPLAWFMITTIPAKLPCLIPQLYVMPSIHTAPVVQSILPIWINVHCCLHTQSYFSMSCFKLMESTSKSCFFINLWSIYLYCRWIEYLLHYD